jgi:threonine dehydrogenase-like Zn-dependent dehydrogenase
MRVIAVETNKDRLKLAREFGAEHALTPDEFQQQLKDLTKGEGVDLSLDTTGNSSARLAAIRSAKTWGTVCFVGEGGDVTINVSPDMLRKQLTLIGSWTFSAMGQAECARFIVDNGIALERIFSHRWKLDQAGEAYRVFDTQSTGKGVITF